MNYGQGRSTPHEKRFTDLCVEAFYLRGEARVPVRVTVSVLGSSVLRSNIS